MTRNMTRNIPKALAATVLMIAATFAVAVTPASAGHVTCGTTIVANTTLDGNVGPCSSTAIIVGASNITLDLAGFTVSGQPDPTTGEGPGILVQGKTNVIVKRGTVKDFDAGVALVGGGNHELMQLIVNKNIGSSSTDFGDGIAIFNSADNKVHDNQITENAPFDGVGMFGASSDRNRIYRNVISDNSGVRTFGPHGPTEEDDGVRMEPGTDFNIVERNVIERNGLDGVAVFVNATNNVIRQNVIRNNGFHEQPNRLGDGIRVFINGNSTLVERNVVQNNAANGIFIQSQNNTIQRNAANGNALLDGRDQAPDCDANVWQQNVFGTSFPACVQ